MLFFDILITPKCWTQLKRLEIPEISIGTDENLTKILQNIPNLKHFNAKLSEITDFTIISKLCPNINILVIQFARYGYYKVTNDNINNLTLHLTNLKMFSIFVQGQHINSEGIKYIANNCPKLQVLEMINFGSLNSTGFVQLVNKCPDLKLLKLNHGIILLYDLEYLSNNLLKLKYMHIKCFTLGNESIYQF